MVIGGDFYNHPSLTPQHDIRLRRTIEALVRLPFLVYISHVIFFVFCI